MGRLFTENNAAIQIKHISIGTVHLKWDSCEPLHRKVEVEIIDDDQDMQHFFKHSQWHQQIIWASRGSPWVSISIWTRWSLPLSPFVILHSNFYIKRYSLLLLLLLRTELKHEHITSPLLFPGLFQQIASPIEGMFTSYYVTIFRPGGVLTLMIRVFAFCFFYSWIWT